VLGKSGRGLAFGVLGKSGRGLAEHYGVPVIVLPSAVLNVSP